MLSLSLEQACYVVVKAREFDVQDVSSETGDGSNPTDDGMAAVLEDDPARNPVENELADFIDGLNIDQQVELVALAWLGRGDYTRSDWQELVREASEAHSSHTGSYLTDMPLLADYIEQGLEELGFSCADVESDRL